MSEPRDVEALEAEPAWEMFCDAAYFDMWCVRPVGECTFGNGFHLPSKAEAQALLDAFESERSARVRLEKALEWCNAICAHAVEHYKGPVAMKIKREIAVHVGRTLSGEGGSR